jgi:hypothetical protein
MKAGDILRVVNQTEGADFFYMVNEIRVAGIAHESVAILQSLTFRVDQSDGLSGFHQIPLPLLDGNDRYEVYSKSM